jgi:hypothetical protein
MYAMAVSEAPASSGLLDGTHRIDTAWLAVGNCKGVVRIWDLETKRCMTRLDARKDGLAKDPWFDEIEMARDGGRVVAWDERLSDCTSVRRLRAAWRLAEADRGVEQ